MHLSVLQVRKQRCVLSLDARVHLVLCQMPEFIFVSLAPVAAFGRLAFSVRCPSVSGLFGLVPPLSLLFALRFAEQCLRFHFSAWGVCLVWWAVAFVWFAGLLWLGEPVAGGNQLHVVSVLPWVWACLGVGFAGVSVGARG